MMRPASAGYAVGEGVMRRKTKQRKSGFTLIELLLVAGILAVLAAFLAPQLFGQAEKARKLLAKFSCGWSRWAKVLKILGDGCSGASCKRSRLRERQNPPRRLRTSLTNTAPLVF